MLFFTTFQSDSETMAEDLRQIRREGVIFVEKDVCTTAYGANYNDSFLTRKLLPWCSGNLSCDYETQWMNKINKDWVNDSTEEILNKELTLIQAFLASPEDSELQKLIASFLSITFLLYLLHTKVQLCQPSKIN